MTNTAQERMDHLAQVLRGDDHDCHASPEDGCAACVERAELLDEIDAANQNDPRVDEVTDEDVAGVLKQNDETQS